MQEYQIYHYIFQKLPSNREVNKIFSENILKCAIVEYKDDGKTKVKMIDCISVKYRHVAYVTREVVANLFFDSFLFIYLYWSIII